MKPAEFMPASRIEQWVARIVREDIRSLRPYSVPESAGMVKLDAMENPHALPPALRAQLGELASAVALNRYPDPLARELKAALREYMQVPDAMELVLGNGSDEIIQLLALGCARPGGSMLGVEPSFAMFPLIARVCGLQFVGVPLRADFSLDTDAVIVAMARHRPALVFLAYPNNPTGNLFDAAAIERIVRAAPGLVVIDEAYHPFAQASFMPRLQEFPNLVLMRTLSKLGLAGLRLGMLIASPEWSVQFEKLRLPYNVNALSQVVATRVLRSAHVLEAQAAEIRNERSRLAAKLQAMPGVEVYPSQANFLLFRVPGAPAVCAALNASGILIKNLAGAHPALENCLRVTVGTAAENDAFLAALAAGLGTAHA
ncbi:MAG: histidinol-phosphate transaminase [Burkholderiales bacterium]